MSNNKYEVIKEIPRGRFLYRFDCYSLIPVGTILASNGRCVIYDGGFICDIGSEFEKKYLRKIED